MKKGQLKTLRINGESLQAEFLGKGSFNTCYRVGDSVYCFVRIGESYDYTDYSKDIIRDSVDSIHLPIVEYIDDNDKYTIYKVSLYYPLVKGSVAYKQAKILYKAWQNYRYDNRLDNFTNNHNFINTLESVLPDTIVDALRSLVDSSGNYSLNYRLEFPLRNMLQDTEGNLILLDVIFNPHALKSFQYS